MPPAHISVGLWWEKGGGKTSGWSTVQFHEESPIKRKKRRGPKHGFKDHYSSEIKESKKREKGRMKTWDQTNEVQPKLNQKKEKKDEGEKSSAIAWELKKEACREKNLKKSNGVPTGVEAGGAFSARKTSKSGCTVEWGTANRPHCPLTITNRRRQGGTTKSSENDRSPKPKGNIQKGKREKLTKLFVYFLGAGNRKRKKDREGEYTSLPRGG